MRTSVVAGASRVHAWAILRAMSTTTGPRRRATRGTGWRELPAVLLIRAAHPRQVLGHRGSPRGRRGRRRTAAARGGLVGADRARRGSRSWAGATISPTGRPTPPAARQAARRGAARPGHRLVRAHLCGAGRRTPLHRPRRPRRRRLPRLARPSRWSATASSTRGCCRSCRGWRASRSTRRSWRTAAGTASAPTTPPTWPMVALAAALGLCVHVLLALPGLVHDHAEGERSLPLVLALRTGTPRLLLLCERASRARSTWRSWCRAGPSD